jgi:DNA topoisomerase I
VIAQARRHARASGLLYVSDAEPGITRRRRGKGFEYLGRSRRPIKAVRTLERIRRLAIPPAYSDVWVCLDARGHLQATGRDARRRKQYRYHAKWRATRDDGKFSHMIEFGARLPQLRRRLKQDLALPGLPKYKVLAVIVTLLDGTLIRIGNREYARTNDSYGLTTLRDKHVSFLRDGRASFSFRGKGGRRHEVTLDDRRLVKLLRSLQQLPGQHLFQYVDDEGKRQSIDSGMVNDYLREAMGEDARWSAKDFRTWGATVLAVAFLSRQPHDESTNEAAFKRCMTATAKHVAEALRNTPAVCRKSYINPVVFAAWRVGAFARLASGAGLAPRKVEKIALQVLRSAGRTAKLNGARAPRAAVQARATRKFAGRRISKSLRQEEGIRPA